MIILDWREGSADLLPHFLPGTAQLSEHDMETDASFLGDGPGGKTVRIGVEVKQLSDVLKCIQDGRFAGEQLPSLVKFTSYWLVIIGLFKTDERTGMLIQRRGKDWREVQFGKRRFMGSDLEHWLMTMEMKAGVRYRHVTSNRQAAMFIYSLYRWWNDKGWDGHNSHLQLHDTSPEVGLIKKASLKRNIAKEIPHIGWQRSAAAEDYFDSIKDMINATAMRWADMPTHKDKNDVEYTLGMKRGREIEEALNG